MGDLAKRPQASKENGHRKKHHPGDHWRHYEVSGQFNACMSDPENDGEKDKNGSEKGQQNSEGSDGQDKICLDGDLRGDAHVNSKGLIVGQAEVHSNHNAIDVNFEMQANRKHKQKRKDDQHKSQNSSGEDYSGQGPGGPHAPAEPNDQTSSESDDTSRGPTQKSLGTHAMKEQLPTPGLTSGDSAGSRETTGEASGGDSGTADSGETLSTATSGDASAESNGSNSNNSNGNTNTPEDSNSGDSKEDSPSSADAKDEIPRNTEIFNLSSTQVNQAPFIQKLYAMLEDEKLQHVIRWAPSFDRFYINPNEQFSKTLCLYFKHTNISSFVRQLSMYGFHKVSNSNQQRDKWYPWEFRHMDGLFKRGDLESLRSIKRRSTRQMNSKRVKYLSVVNGNDQVKAEPSPNYMPGPLPVASPAPGQVLQQFQPDQQAPQQRNPPTAVPFAPHHQSPMPQHMIYPDLNGNGNTNGNGNSIVPNGHQMNSAMSGNGHMGSTQNEPTVRLMRMHQAVQSQMVMVQETMGRLSQNVNEMGVVIDQLVSEQQTRNQGPMHSHISHEAQPSVMGNGHGPVDGDKGIPGAANGNNHHHHQLQPQQSIPPLQQPQQPPSQFQQQQDDSQGRFQLRTLLN